MPIYRFGHRIRGKGTLFLSLECISNQNKDSSSFPSPSQSGNTVLRGHKAVIGVEFFIASKITATKLTGAQLPVKDTRSTKSATGEIYFLTVAPGVQFPSSLLI